MRAIQIPSRGGAFERVERPMPEPAKGQVRVKVEVCGICHGEDVAIQGHWPGVTYPRIPGHEVVGVVEKIGAEVSGVVLGERVGIGWSAGGHDLVTGLTVDGGYAEYLLANPEAMVRIPDGLSSEMAAPLMCAGVTTFSALRHSVARAGDLAAVQGIGGLGHLAIQFAAKSGFRTVAISRGKQKEALARRLGAHEYLDGAAVDVAKALQAMGGAKVILSTAPDSRAISAAVDGLAFGGEVVIVAGASGKLELTPIQLLHRKTVRGWVPGGAEEIAETLDFCVLHRIEPMIEVFPLERAAEAFQKMLQTEIRFRAVLKA